MAFGILAKNANGDTVIDAVLPCLMFKSSFTRSTSRNLGSGLRGFTRTGPLVQTGTEVLLVKSRSGQWVGFDTPLASDNVMGLVSNQRNLDCIKLDVPDNLPAPVGFGAVVRNAAGQRVWGHNAGLGYITDGLFRNVSSASFDETWTTLLTGNAVALSGGGTKVWFNGQKVIGLTARRPNSTQIELS